MAKKNPISHTPAPIWVVQDHKFPDGEIYPAHRHPNGGGWVSEDSKVDESTFLQKDVHVYGSSKIYGSCQILGNATIYHSHLSGNHEKALYIDSYAAEIKYSKILANSGRVHIYTSRAYLENCRCVCNKASGCIDISGQFFAVDTFIEAGVINIGGHISLHKVHLNKNVHLRGMMKLYDVYLTDADIENELTIRNGAMTGDIEFNMGLYPNDYIGIQVPNGNLNKITNPTQLMSFSVYKSMRLIDGEIKDYFQTEEDENLTKEIAKLNEMLEESDRLNDELQTKLLDFHLQTP